jgi:elongation factor Ts
MSINASLVKELRDKTGAGFMDCKEALAQSGGDTEKAVEYLRKKGLSAAAKRASRPASEGVVGSYIHMGGKIGVLVEVNCETDFVARTDDFQELVTDLAMQVAATNPRFVRREQVPAELVEKEREIFRAQALESGKPETVLDRIVDGKIEKYYQEICLEEQEFIRESGTTVLNRVKSVAGKLGENIQVNRFARYEIGEGQEKGTC